MTGSRWKKRKEDEGNDRKMTKGENREEKNTEGVKNKEDKVMRKGNRKAKGEDNEMSNR